MRPYRRHIGVVPNEWRIAVCLYVVIGRHEPHDAVQVIGHDDQSIGLQVDLAADLCRSQPFISSHQAERGQLHKAIHDGAEEAVGLCLTNVTK